jgi:anti-sigma factor ChrR (cupin superfamily)
MKRKPIKSTARSPRPAPAEPLGAAETLSEETALIALAAPVATPSAKVKVQLLARIRASKSSVPVGWRFESAHVAEGWRATFPGVRFKTLSVDDARDVVNLLVEMAPGARFPDHPHDDGGDEGIVISGDVVMDGRTLRAGDYYHADVGTQHVDIVSPSGCIATLCMRASVWRKWRERAAAR